MHGYRPLCNHYFTVVMKVRGDAFVKADILHVVYSGSVLNGCYIQLWYFSALQRQIRLFSSLYFIFAESLSLSPFPIHHYISDSCLMTFTTSVIATSVRRHVLVSYCKPRCLVSCLSSPDISSIAKHVCSVTAAVVNLYSVTVNTNRNAWLTLSD